MISTRSRLLLIPLLSLLPFSFFFVAKAEKINVRVQVGSQTSTVSGYDSAGVIYVSVKGYSSALSLPTFENAAWKKIEIRLQNCRMKLAAANPFVSITNSDDGTSSTYQFSAEVLFLDSTFFAPANQFAALVERLSGVTATLSVENLVVSQASPAERPRYDITGLDLETRSNGFLLIIRASRKLGEYDVILRADGWLIVRIVDAQADTVAIRRFNAGPAIRKIDVFPSATSLQLTFKVSPDIMQADPQVDERTNDLLISLYSRSAAEKAEKEKKAQDEVRDRLDDRRSQSMLDVIVIDAGHGGKDPGTIGVAGTREKDVALGVALKLGKLLEQYYKDELKVVYTRKTDTFIELDRRAQIANEEGGKLFISIHCNSTERKPSSANGFEIYILKPGKTQSAIRIAEIENSPIQMEEGYKDRYKELTEENFILVTMRQSAFARYSEEFAEKASEAMASLLKIQNSGVKQAGFYVLVGASMPNVLVETGFLSNRQEERVLRSEQGQKKIAEALFEGIKLYKTDYEQELQEGGKQGSQSH